jgi:uncharacterized protein DUF6247
MVISVTDLDPSRRSAARSRKAPAWPVSLRDRYGSITVAEVLRFYLIRWDTHRNLRRRRKRQGRPRAGGHPLLPGATPAAIREALLPDDRERFGDAYSHALAGPAAAIDAEPGVR